jgi:hypothetical protein
VVRVSVWVTPPGEGFAVGVAVGLQPPLHEVMVTVEVVSVVMTEVPLVVVIGQMVVVV